MSLSLGPAGVVGGGVNVQHSLSTFSTTTEVRPLSKAPNPRLLPGAAASTAAHCSGCVFTCVCVWVCVHGVVCVGVCSRWCVCSRCVCALWMALAGGQYSLSTVSDVFDMIMWPCIDVGESR